MKKWGMKELKLSVMGPADSRMPMPQHSWSIIQRPRTGVTRLPVCVGEDGFGGQGLVDLAAVVGAFGLGDGGSVADYGDIGAFAGDEGLVDVVAHVVRAVGVGFEEEFVVRVQFPEDGEDAFV